MDATDTDSNDTRDTLTSRDASDTTPTDGSDGGADVTDTTDSGTIDADGGDADACLANEMCNGADDDCDGAVDEGCSCTYDPTEADHVDTDSSHANGVCPNQTRDAHGVCQTPADFPSPESSCSDGLDNDCDGAADSSDSDCGGSGAPGQSCSSNSDCRSVCLSGVCAHRIFVSSTRYDGGLGQLSGADQKCGRLASGAGLSGNWKAVASNLMNDAKDRLSITAPVVDMSHNKVADGASDFWSSSHDGPIDETENNNSVTGRVWTGTNPDGTEDGNNQSGPGKFCGNWDNDSSTKIGAAGDCTASNSAEWTNRESADLTCDTQIRLYCIDGQ